MILSHLIFNQFLSSAALWTNAGLLVHVQIANQLSGHCNRHNIDAQQNLWRCTAILRPRPLATQARLSTQHHAGQVVRPVQSVMALLHRHGAREGHLRDNRVV